MIRWILLLSLLIISAAIIGFGEPGPAIEGVAKSVYFTVTILLIFSLLLRDIRRKKLQDQ